MKCRLGLNPAQGAFIPDRSGQQTQVCVICLGVNQALTDSRRTAPDWKEICGVQDKQPITGV